MEDLYIYIYTSWGFIEHIFIQIAELTYPLMKLHGKFEATSIHSGRCSWSRTGPRSVLSSHSSKVWLRAWLGDLLIVAGRGVVVWKSVNDVNMNDVTMWICKYIKYESFKQKRSLMYLIFSTCWCGMVCVTVCFCLFLVPKCMISVLCIYIYL